MGEKARGLVKFLESKHPDAKLSEHKVGSTTSIWNITYRNEAGVIENPYNLEDVQIFTMIGDPGVYLLRIYYNFYGTEKIAGHIKKLKNEKEFGDF